jgi:drug/metabolite transporter (DMT)-like permease
MTNILNITIWAFVSAILSEAYFFFVLSKGEVSITGTLLASYPIYTALFSRFINNESLNLLQFLAISITIIGTLIVSTEGKIKIKDLKKRDYVFWALSGAIAVGLSDSLSKRAIDQVSMQDFLVALAVVQLPISLVYLKLEKQSFKEIIKSVKKLEKYRFAILGSVLNVVGVLFLWLSFENTLASIASPLTATYPVLMVILAHFLLKEKIKRKDYLGIALVLVGVVLISIA